MKSLFTFAGIAMLCLIFSCGKEKIQPESAPSINQVEKSEKISKDVEASGNRLKFESVSSYENLFSEGADTKRKTVIQKSENSKAFTSLSRFSSDPNTYGHLRRSSSALVDSLYPDFLRKILNPDGIVQIGEHIIKVDMSEEKVYVLNEKDSADYNDLLNSNTSNPNIRVFSTSDEVLSILSGEKEPNKRVSLFCTDGRADEDDGNVEWHYGDGYRLKCKLEYQTAGIYFSLLMKVKNQAKFAGVWLAQNGFMKIDYSYKYKPRCRGVQEKSDIISENNNKLSDRPWENTRALSKYRFSAVFSNQWALPDAKTNLRIARYGY